MSSDKTEVVEYLGKRFIAGDFPDGIVTNDDIVDAIETMKSSLSKRNPANFLKDIIRKSSANENWPESLKQQRITARQRYGKKRVMQFYRYPADQTVPFPDPFGSNSETHDYLVQTASLPYISRQLGRSEETWLTQIAVNLRLVETQLSLFSADARAGRLRDVSHLQTGIKTQPEIDAGYVASFSVGERPGAGVEYCYVTCEVKQRNERILPDQIREQVAKAFEITKSLKEPIISLVKPIAMHAVATGMGKASEVGIYLVEFQSISRGDFEAQVVGNPNEEALYGLELIRSSTTLYRCRPPINALK
ncbi:MAG: hypothetical protein ACKOQ3_10395 [Novosphingobium sp.]